MTAATDSPAARGAGTAAAAPPLPRPAALARRLAARVLAVGGRARVAFLLLLTLAATLAEGAGLLLLVPLLERLGLGAPDASPAAAGIAPVVLLAVGLAAAAAGLVALRTVAVAALRARVLDALRRELHAAVLAMAWPAARAERPAALQQILTQEVARLAMALEALSGLAVTACLVPVLLAVALWLSPALTLLALAGAGLGLLATRRLGRAAYALGARLGTTARAYAQDLGDDLQGLREIKAFDAAAARATRLSGHLDAQAAAVAAHVRAQALERWLLQTAAAIVLGAGLVATVALDGGTLAAAGALVLAAGRLAQTLLRGLAHARTLTTALPALATVEAALARARAAAEPAARADPPPRLRAALTLTGAHRVHADGRVALAGVDAVIPALRTTALIGPSGAGKTTLAELAAGLCGPDAGTVLLDGRPLDAAGRPAWRRRVALVPQDPFLFHDTVRANLRLARPDASDADLRDALEAAAAAAFVARLPEGLDTVVGERGQALSGGERQRLALARALLRAPDLLVLDEATAALDQETEAAVRAALAGLRGRVTVLLVAHRPATVRDADHLILLEAGRVVAMGGWAAVRAAAGDRLAALGMTMADPG